MRVILLLAVLLLTSALAACGSETPTNTPSPSPTLVPLPTATPAAEPKGIARDGGVLRLLGRDPPTLDPHLTGDVTSARYVMEIHGGLVTFTRESTLGPGLAESWEIDSSGTAFTFRLSPTAVFHDGRKVTASDMKWSLERAADPETEAVGADVYIGDIIGALDKLNGDADSIAGVSVIDEETLRMEIDAPKAYFIQKVSFPTFFALDRANVETGRDWIKAPNGAGPFTLAEYEPGELIRLERFDGYHLGPAKLDAVEFNLAGGDGMLMYENDEIHIGRIGLAALERVRDPSDPLHDEFHQGPPNFGVAFMGMNVSEPPFDDVNVRLALNYAMDRDTLSNVLLEGIVVPAQGILPPGFPAYNPGLEGYGYDPEKARQLLAESKYGSDTANYPAITITLPGSFGSDVSPLYQAILATWEEQLGITMELLQTEWATFLQDLGDKNFQIYGGSGWVADYPDPQTFLDVLFHTDSDINRYNFSDPELDDLLERARVEQDQEARFSMYRDAERMILESAPVIPIYHSANELYLIKPYIKGFPLVPLIIPRLRYVHFIE